MKKLIIIIFILFIHSIFPFKLFSCGQNSDLLIYKGLTNTISRFHFMTIPNYTNIQKLIISSTPLYPFSSACRRGYKAIYEITNNMLYLIAIKTGYGNKKNANLKKIFKNTNKSNSVHAKLITGFICALKYPYKVTEYIYNTDKNKSKPKIFEIENGKIIFKNEKMPVNKLLKGYVRSRGFKSIKACVSFVLPYYFNFYSKKYNENEIARYNNKICYKDIDGKMSLTGKFEFNNKRNKFHKRPELIKKILNASLDKYKNNYTFQSPIYKRMEWSGYAGWADGKKKDSNEYMRVFIVSFVMYNKNCKLILYFKANSIEKIKFDEISNNIFESIYFWESR